MAPRSPTPRSGSFIPSFRLRPQWSSRNGTPSAPTPVVNPRLDLTRAEEDDDTELQLHGQQLEGGNEESEVEEEGLEGEENEDDGGEEEGEEEDEEDTSATTYNLKPSEASFKMYGSRTRVRLERALTLGDETQLPSPPLDGPSQPGSQARTPSSSNSSIADELAIEPNTIRMDFQEAKELANRIIQKVPMEIDSLFEPAALGLKEIGNLASWTVSSCKPGCGVDALRDDDTGLFWQSDGPQPHHLNIHFSRLVSILSIRIFLDFEADESYTPTRITLLAGTGYHDLIPFAALNFEQPKGWLDVPLDHVGGGPDGKTLRTFLVQVRIVENHQNGKDTHVRGLKIYARDDRARAGLGGLLGDENMEMKAFGKAQGPGMERSWLVEPDWMGEPELR
ncbi:uncharacterized protein RAG0_05115 [Rhynchosporium agropyri]|uniref:DOC domain-containing protein n=1 Tax=Rhynchosporium agropyri TaxID=914238 RepID=A0A1E1KBS7_9HELO|nr:uncharacterized protein RAG0_05115 [Rhynchosporium agropyri]